MKCFFYFLRNYSINYFRCFLWCGPKADKEKQRCRRTQSRDRGCHQKSIFSLRFTVRAAFCGPFFLISALTFLMWVLLLTFDIFCVFCSTLNFSGGKNIFREFSIFQPQKWHFFSDFNSIVKTWGGCQNLRIFQHYHIRRAHDHNHHG